MLLKNNKLAQSGENALPINLTKINKIAVLGPQADKVELGDYSGPVEPELRITPLQGIRSYIANNNLSTEVITRSGGNTDRRTDFFSMTGFSTISDGKVKMDFDATKFDEAANGVIASYRFGQNVLQGIKDGDWTLYKNVDISNVDSIRLNTGVSGDGGILEVRVGSASGNILASQEIKPLQNRGNLRNSGRNQIIPVKILPSSHRITYTKRDQRNSTRGQTGAENPVCFRSIKAWERCFVRKIASALDTFSIPSRTGRSRPRQKYRLPEPAIR